MAAGARTSSRAIRKTTRSTASSTSATRRSRWPSAAGGCRARCKATAPPPTPPNKFDNGFRAHNTNVYPERPDRCYLGYIDGGIMVLDIADRARPKLISTWRNSPPYNGFMHTVCRSSTATCWWSPTSRCRTTAADWPKLVWLLDARDEKNPCPSPRCPVPAVEAAAIAAAASVRTTCTKTRRSRAPGARRSTCSAPSSTPAYAPTICPIPISRRRWRRSYRRRQKARQPTRSNQ